MPKVSVIIPVYGVEKYIKRCARSLFEQTLDDIEYLFIDDCTPDKSIEVLKRVLEEYPQRKPQVKIHQMEQNSGQAKVREWGMKNAMGDYVIHCDSDDWVDTDMYRAMYEKAKENETDIIVCDYIVNDGNRNLERVQGCHDLQMNQFKKNLLFQKDPWPLWNKLFRRKLYTKDLIYPSSNMGEDMALVLQIIRNCKSVGYVNNVCYYYRYNDSSITNAVTEEKVFDTFQQSMQNLDIVLKVYKNDNEIYLKSALRCIKWGQKTILFPIIKNPKYYKIWRDTFPGLEKEIIFDRNCNLKLRIKCILTLLHIYPWKDYSNRIHRCM